MGRRGRQGSPVKDSRAAPALKGGYILFVLDYRPPTGGGKFKIQTENAEAPNLA